MLGNSKILCGALNRPAQSECLNHSLVNNENQRSVYNDQMLMSPS